MIGSRIKGGTLYRCAIGLRLAVRSVLPAENQTRDQYKPVTAIGTMKVGSFMSVTSFRLMFTPYRVSLSSSRDFVIFFWGLIF